MSRGLGIEEDMLSYSQGHATGSSRIGWRKFSKEARRRADGVF